MTTEELLEAFKNDRRTPVDVNFGQIPLSPTIGRAGNYQVVQRGVIQDNPLTELSRVLAQAPQLAGQFKNIQEKAGVQEVQSLDNEEIERRVEQGDTEATGFLKDWGKQRSYSRALYDQYFKTKKAPAIEALTSEIANMTPDELSEFLTDGGSVSALNDDQLQSALENKFREASSPADDIKLDDHMRVLHNEALRRVPLLAAQALGSIRKKQSDYIDFQTTDLLEGSVSGYQPEEYSGEQGGPELELPQGAGGLGQTLLPKNGNTTQPFTPSVRGKVTVYSPQKGGDKMEGGYPSSVRGPDGKALVRTVADVVRGSSDYVTLAGSPEFYGRSYIIPSLPYTDPKTGEVKYLENVKGVVHDTGSAFTGAPEGRFDIPLGKDLDNKAMNEYNGLLKKNNVRFVREVNQDGDPEDYRDPADGKKKADPTAEQIKNTSKAHYNIYLEQEAVRLGNTLQQAVSGAKAQGSTLTDDTIEKRAVKTLGINLMTLLEQGGDEMAIVDEFLTQLEDGEIMLADRPLFNTAEGKALFTNVQRALNTKQRQMDNEEDEEESTGELNTRDFLKQINAVGISADDGTTNLSPSELRTAEENLKGVNEKANTARANGEIDQRQLNEILTRSASRLEELEGGYQQDPAIINPEFFPNVLNAYNIRETLQTLGTKDSVFALLSQHEDDPIAGFKQVISDDTTGTMQEFIFGEVTRIGPIAKEKADFEFRKYLHNLYTENDVNSGQTIQDVTRDDLREKYTKLIEEAALEEFARQKENVENRVSQRVKTLANVNAEKEIPVGMTAEQVEAERAIEQEETTVLDRSGKLRKERLFESTTTYLKRAVETFTNEEDVETMKANNPPKRVAQFYQVSQDRYFRMLQFANIQDHESRRKKAEEAYKFTKQLGMPMKVIRNGFNATLKRPEDVVPYEPFALLQLNSNNRFETLDYATNGVYNLNASLQAANGNTGALREIYGYVFNTDAKKEVVSLDDFIQLQIKLGQKQGRIKPSKSNNQ